MKRRKILILSSCLLLSGITFGSIAGCSNDTENQGQTSTIESVVIAKKYTSLRIGSADVKLEAIVNPSNAKQDVTWTSSDENIATVSAEGTLSVKGIGKTTITAISTVDTSKKDSFVLEVTGTVLSGTVTGLNGEAISGVTLSIGGRSATSGSDGKYSITLDGTEKDFILEASKDGYASRTFDLTEQIKVSDGLIEQAVTLYALDEKVSVTLTGKVANVNDPEIDGAEIKVNDTTVTTLEDGSFKIENIEIGSEFVLTATKENFIVANKTYKLEDFLAQILAGNRTLDLGTIDLKNETEAYEVYASGDGTRHSEVNIYRGLEDVTFKFSSDFKLSETSFYFELFLDFGETSPSDYNHLDNRDSLFCISSKGFDSQTHYSGSFGEGTPTHLYTENLEANTSIVEVSFPYSYLKAGNDEIFGFHVIDHYPGDTDYNMKNLSGYTSEWYNTYTYPRVGMDGTIYQSNVNNNVLESEIVTRSEVLGHVGTDANYTYSISMGKSDTGLYIIADKDDKTNPFIQDVTYYHFFIDTEQNQENFDRETDGKVKHFALESGKWLVKYDVKGPNAVFDNKVENNDLINDGVKFESTKGKTVVYIPYDVLGEDINKDSSFGIAANIEQGAGNRNKWQAPYVGGYVSEPHVEEPASFVRLDKNLKVIPNTWGQNSPEFQVGSVEILNKQSELTVLSSGVTLSAKVSPDTAEQSVVWSSSDETIASVENGLLKPLKVGKATITATSVKDPSKSDSFEVEVKEGTITGKVSDSNNTPINGVTVKYGEKSTSTNEEGTYSINYDGSENGQLSFEKEGYISQTENISSLLSNGNPTKDVTLLKEEESEFTKNVSGKIIGVSGALVDASIKVGETTINSKEDGTFTFENLTFKGDITLEVAKDGYQSREIVISIQDIIDDVMDEDNNVNLGEIYLVHESNGYEIYKTDSRSTNLYVYREESALTFDFISSFDPRTISGFRYETFLDFGDTLIHSDNGRQDSRDCNFTLNGDGTVGFEAYQGTQFGPGEATTSLTEVDGQYHLSVKLPYEFLRIERNEVFGFMTFTHEETGAKANANPSGVNSEYDNQFTYTRCGLDGTFYLDTSNNPSAFDELEAQITKQSEVLGVVGEGYTGFRYKLSIGKNSEGIFIITESENQELQGIKPSSILNVFIDVAQNEEDFNRNGIDNRCTRWANVQGRWGYKYFVNHSSDVNTQDKDYAALMTESGLKFHTKGSKSITFIPYELLGKDSGTSVDENSIIGVAANVECDDENGHHWGQWTEYPESYVENPHVEDARSFIRLDKDLNVITNTWNVK